MSIELRPLMVVAERDRAEKRLRSSGGRLRGCVSRSSLLLREEEEETLGSVECLAKRECRDDEDFTSRDDSDRDDFFGDL